MKDFAPEWGDEVGGGLDEVAVVGDEM